MKKAFWNILKVSPAVALTLLVGNSAFAGEVNGKVTSVAELSQNPNNLSQTPGSQFSDVPINHWAFQSLQLLVERYGCVSGYNDGTFRGNRSLNRYEFAVSLKQCLDRVNEFIASATADLVTKQDLATLQRLQEEFSTELATIRGQVDALEARTGELEANQFSTTTKLSGEAIFSVSQAFGDKVAVASSATGTRPTTDLTSNATLSDRVRLSLNSSFTGTDQLQTRLQGRNIIQNNNTADNSGTGTNMTRLGYDGSAGENNSLTIDKLNYAFNLKNNIRVRIDAVGGELNENVNVFNPDFRSSGTGALSRYGRFSPIYRQANDGAGITVNVNPNGKLGLSAAYFATGRDNNANNPAPGSGLFGGNNTMFGQLALKPNQAINIGLTYAHTYSGTGTPNLFGSTGSARANTLGLTAGTKVEASNYGIQGTLQPTKNITLGGWGGYTTASTLTGNSTNGEIWYWAATLGIKDFGKEGNTLGLIVGQSPKLTGGSVRSINRNTGLLETNNVTRDFNTSYHIEGLYKVKLSDNILVTPGVIVILNPEHNDKNSAEYVGTLRTTFTF